MVAVSAGAYRARRDLGPGLPLKMPRCRRSSSLGSLDDVMGLPGVTKAQVTSEY